MLNHHFPAWRRLCVAVILLSLASIIGFYVCRSYFNARPSRSINQEPGERSQIVITQSPGVPSPAQSSRLRWAHRSLRSLDSLGSNQGSLSRLAQPVPPDDRWSLFFSKRAYPFGSIPSDYRRRAWESRQRGPLDDGAMVSESASADAPTWRNIGPMPTTSAYGSVTSGRINAIAVAPNNPNLVLVGSSSGGIWRSTDGGQTFAPVTDSQVDFAVGALAFAPSNPSIVYAAMGDPSSGGNGTNIFFSSGVLKSTDGGQTWARINNQTLPPGASSRIVVNATNPDRVYLAQRLTAPRSGFPGLYVSSDGGINWQHTLVGEARDLIAHPTDASILFAAMAQVLPDGAAGIYKSTDGGSSWKQIYTAPYFSGDISFAANIRVAISPANPNRIYTYNGGLINLKFSLRVEVSDDGGQTWTNLGGDGVIDEGQFGYNNYLFVDPTNADTVYVGTRVVHKSIDGGRTWTTLTPISDNQTHPDQHFLTFAPNNGQTVYIANDGGLFRSTDGGQHFQQLNNTLSLTQFYTLALHQTNSARSYGGTQDNGVQRRENNSALWKDLNGGDGGPVVINPLNPSQIFTSILFAGIYRLSDNGNQFDKDVFPKDLVQNGDSYNSLDGAFVGNGVDSRLYLGTKRLLISTDLGETWVAPAGSQKLIKNEIDYVAVIGISQVDLNVIYTGSSQGLVMASNDGGKTFHDITAGLPNRAITSIRPDPIDVNTVYLTVSGFQAGHVFKSINQGQTWLDISGNLPDTPVSDFALDPADLRVLYIGTDIGVFRSSNGGQSWVSFSNGLPPTLITALATNKVGAVQLATYGRGMYELARPIDTTIPADLRVTMKAEDGPAAKNSPLKYTAEVLNAGPGLATNLTISDLLPAGATLLSATPLIGSCSGTSCQLGDLSAGARVKVEFVVNTPSQLDVITNTVTVSATNSDPDSSNNTAAVQTQLSNPSVDLRVEASASTPTAPEGGSVTYIIKVTNNGPTTASNVIVDDVLPDRMAVSNVTASQGTCEVKDSVICKLGILANGAQAEIKITGSVALKGIARNMASVRAAQPDPNLTNSSVTIDVTVTDAAIGFDFAEGSFVAANFAFNGAAKLATTGLQLTEIRPNQVGSIWLQQKQPVQSGFETRFRVTEQPPQSPAEGFAFVIHNLPLSALGNNPGIGYDGLSNSLAVEFDLRWDPSFHDLTSNHVSVHTRGELPNSADESASLGSTTAIPSLMDGNIHEIKIRYASNTLSIFIDNLDTPVLTVNVNLAKTLKLGAGGTAVIGFTGATGFGLQQREILSWSFTPLGKLVNLSIPPPLSQIQGTLNSNVTYTLQVVNGGSETATQVRLVDTLPMAATFVSARTTKGNCTGTNVVTCELGSLASGESVSLEITILPGTVGNLLKQATVTAAESDYSPLNNTLKQHLLIAGDAGPVVTVSAASYAPDAVAPEVIASIFGANLATGIGFANSLPLPTTLLGTSVLVNGVAAPLFFVSPGQINLLIPPETQLGTAVIEVVSGDGALSRGSLTIAATGPSLFTSNTQGFGAPAAVATNDGVHYRIVGNPDGTSNPLHTDDYLVLFGTGIRHAAKEAVQITIGGVSVPVLYAGAQGEFVGLDQINTQIPVGLSGEVDVIVSVNGKAANVVKIRVQ